MHTAESRSLLTRALYTCRNDFHLEESIGCHTELTFGPSRKLKCRIAGEGNEPLGLTLGRAEGGDPCNDHVFGANRTGDWCPCLTKYLQSVNINSFSNLSVHVEIHVIVISKIQGTGNALGRKITLSALVLL